MTAFKHLFEPADLGGIPLKNRIAFAPTGMGNCTIEGDITDQSICHYIARAKGGTGLIIVEHTVVQNLYSKAAPRLLTIHDDRQVYEWSALAEAIHRCGSKAIVQLSLGLGRQGTNRWDGKDLVAPSAVNYTIAEGSAPGPMKSSEGRTSKTPRALTTEEVKHLEDLFAAAAKVVRNAGFDGIEIHGAHGYLLAGFVSPLSNHRADEYGGDFSRRLRLPINIIQKTRKAVGDNFTVGYRISGDEHTEGGQTIEDTLKIIPILTDEGIDFIHLSSGWNGALNWMFPDREGVILSEAREIKTTTNLPVICPNFHDPKVAEAALEEKSVDIVSLSRGLLADPAWALKAQEGRVDEIIKCIFCYKCVSTFGSGIGTKCTVNPEVGWERFNKEYQPF